MKRTAYVEGTQAWERFQRAMKRVVSVPHEVVQAQIEEHRLQSARDPHKRGPKSKKK